ncbi:E3 ubiquitin-protein ligase [Canna indica]|uniref:E3 ubiquitin-protein ligase n=1 Tax=Canna indica TaxID=4628 RepID=A0AAQ3JQV1_9LILI|nr:E3 ubiquitin-protein ligase [Canna indica]
MAAESESTSPSAGSLELLMEEAMGGSGSREGRPPGFFQVILGVMGTPAEAADGVTPPDLLDRIVLVNPVTQGMVVLQGDPAVVAELLSERGVASGQPPASKASIEAMRMVEDVGGVQKDECAVCLDELGGSGEGEHAAVVREMPCGHRFHQGCIVKWLKMHGSCPVCRFQMPADDDGGPKKGAGEEEYNESGRRGLWVTIVYSRRPNSTESHQPEDQDGGGGGDGVAG